MLNEQREVLRNQVVNKALDAATAHVLDMGLRLCKHRTTRDMFGACGCDGAYLKAREIAAKAILGYVENLDNHQVLLSIPDVEDEGYDVGDVLRAIRPSMEEP